MSAVSKKLTPSSHARRIAAAESSSRTVPQPCPPAAQQPMPRRLIVKPVVPRAMRSTSAPPPQDEPKGGAPEDSQVAEEGLGLDVLDAQAILDGQDVAAKDGVGVFAADVGLQVDEVQRGQVRD